MIASQVETSKTSRWRRDFANLRSEFREKSWESHGKELSDNIMPFLGRNLNSENNQTEKNDGRKKHSNIINSTPKQAIRTCAAGIQGGLTSPSRPWFQLSLPSEEMAEVETIRNWLHEVRNLLLGVFSTSNFYGQMHALNYELCLFGTGVMLIEEDIETIARFKTLTYGEYVIALDHKGRPCQLFRMFSVTAYQAVEKFGEEKLTQTIKNALIAGDNKTRFDVIHLIEKNRDIKHGRGDHRGMKWKSVYYPLVDDNGDNTIFRESGYRTCPFVAPRWQVIADNTYGYSPAMEALGDIKQLQKLERDKLMAIAKGVNPAMNAPASMRGKGANTLPGGITYIDAAQGQQSFTPTHQVNLDIADVRVEIAAVEQRIKETFFNNLFLASLAETKDMTAREVSERSQEKMMALGPILENLMSDSLDLIIDRVFSICENLRILPPMPQELPGGLPIEVQYISLLAQAQKMVGNSSLEQLVLMVGQISQMDPSIRHKFNSHEFIDQYASGLGTPPKIINSDDVAEKSMAAEQKQQQMMQMAAMAPQVAGAIKDLGQTPMKGGSMNAIDAMTAGSGQVAPV